MQDMAFNMLDKTTNSQAGEDSILAYATAVLGIPFSDCSYIDLGANHPKEMSNTYFFYSQGARGVLVEANSSLIPDLERERPGDVVLHRCVSDQANKTETFYVTNIDGLSAADKDAITEAMESNESLHVDSVEEVATITVNEILEKYYPNEPPVLLSIDVEGMEMRILRSINWDRWKPLMIIAEMIPYSNKLTIGIKNPEIIGYLHEKGYEEFAFTGINSIFIHAEAAKRIGNQEREGEK
jgi:FkbM family methyltransferase